jgi:hypothetical protein
MIGLPAPMTGRCELCHQHRALQDSHLLPRAVYKALLDRVNRNPHPLLFSRKDEHQTPRQARQFLLCSECEQRFHRLGEDWTLEHYARDPQTFKLRDIILSHPRQGLTDGLYRCDSAAIPEISGDCLCYFALSVVWRAAVRSWTIDHQRITQLALGPYTEVLREYLLGTAPFPENTVVWVCVSSLRPVQLICTFPETRNWGDYRSHSFSIPGLTFTVDLGKRIPQFVRDWCLYRGRGRPLFYTTAADLANMRDIDRLEVLRSGSSNVRGTE